MTILSVFHHQSAPLSVYLCEYTWGLGSDWDHRGVFAKLDINNLFNALNY